MREHFDHLNEVPPMDFVTFMEEIQACVDAIKMATGSERVNVAILGNAESHVHAHLIPRYDDDPLPNKAPWEDPRPKAKLPVDDEDRLMELIKAHLTSAMSTSVVSPVPLSRTRREPRRIPHSVDVPLFDLLADEHSL
jgi:diadenosine tetraphosphate (Ap4A) HIT family hydrolase